MNGGGGGGGGRRKMKIPTMPLIQRRDNRDEDLLLFRELHKREKDHLASLLQPVSDEFEPNAGNYALYKIASGKNFGEKEKNDYDWLKTPPATPLFPSLEMEAAAAEVVVQRELPIVQPLSRFAGNSGAPKGSNSARSNSPKPNPKALPQRSMTPRHRPAIIPPSETRASKGPTTILNHNRKSNISNTTTRISPDNFLTSNLSKTLVGSAMRSTIPAQIPGFSSEPPPNLRTTERSTSATRGRPNSAVSSALHQNKAAEQPGARPRRQSCSPSVTRGRKVDAKQVLQEGDQGQKGRIQNNIVGSRMVEKMMSARKSSGSDQEREAKTKSRGSISQVNGFGSIMARSSLDMALKHTDIKRDRTSSRLLGTIPAKSSNKE